MGLHCHLRSFYLFQEALKALPACHRRWPLLICLFALVSSSGYCQPSRSASQSSLLIETRHILLLHAYHQEYEWSSNVTRGVQSILKKQSQLNLSIEYMDTKHFSDDAYLEHLSHTYALKYAGENLPDVMICSDDHALKFALKHRERIFKDVPIVFCGINNFAEAVLQGQRNITGVVEHPDFKATLELAFELHPRTRKVTILRDQTLTGTGDGARLNRLQNIFPDIIFQELTDLSFAELASELETLDSDTIVLLATFLRDRNNRVASVAQISELISNHCPLPVYTGWDMYIPYGTIGGKVASGFEQGKCAAEYAAMILEGRQADSIPIIQESPNVYIFNNDQLERWGIRTSMLPAGSEILGHKPTLWEQKPEMVITTIATLVVLLVFVILLTSHLVYRQRQERVLLERESRFRALTERMHELTFILSPQGIITYASPSLRFFIDTPVEGILGKEISELLPGFSGKHIERVYASSTDSLKTQIALDVFPLDHSEEGPRDYEASGIDMREVPGVNGIVLHLSDVTDRIAAEAERKNLQEQVQHAQKLESLGVLAGGIAHDFNNLLMAILGHTDLALQDLSTHSPARHHLVEIDHASRHAADLCRQMLAYSGRGRFMIEAININHALDEMEHILAVSISKKVVLKYHLADTLPPVEVDLSQIQQVIMNLVTNASEAIGERSGVISISSGVMHCDSNYLKTTYIREELREGPYVYLEVSDTGCGMDRDTQKKIFDPFFTTKFTGRGLGLAAVLGIVRGHHGAVKVYSEPGRGTTIKVLLPASEKLDEPIPVATQNDSRTDWNATGVILVVDDEETIRLLAKNLLERLGFEVRTAAHGREAVKIYQQAPDEIVCVLLDLTMPHMDGEETFRELRRIRPDIQVIISSGYSELEVVQRFAGKGLAGFIQKPYVLSDLSKKLKEVLQADPLN